MDLLMSVLDFLKSDAGVGLLAGLLVISEALGGIPSVKANSIYQIALGLLKKFVGPKPL